MRHLGLRPTILLLAAIATLWAVPGVAAQSAGPAKSGVVKSSAPPCEVKALGATKCADSLYRYVSQNFLRDRNAAEAAQGFHQVLKLDPKYAPAWFNLGVLAEQREAWLEAQTDFKQYLIVSTNGPDVARAAHEIAVLQPYVEGKAGVAQERQAEYDASISRARILLSKQLYKGAISEAGHAQALDGSRWEAYAVVSLVMYKQHKDDEGKKFADLALARTPPEMKESVAKALVPQP
jgi:tetratricopeptide (TPR) repeat protein